MSIQQNKDLGCQTSQVIIINEDKITCTKSQLQKFWNYLGIENDSVDGKIASFLSYMNRILIFYRTLISLY